MLIWSYRIEQNESEHSYRNQAIGSNGLVNEIRFLIQSGLISTIIRIGLSLKQTVRVESAKYFKYIQCACRY